MSIRIRTSVLAKNKCNYSSKEFTTLPDQEPELNNHTATLSVQMAPLTCGQPSPLLKFVQDCNVCMCIGWSSARTTCLPANRQTDATMKIPTIRGSSPVTLLFWTLVLSSPRRQTALASQSIRTGVVVVVVRWVVSKAVCSSNESTESSWKSTCIYESVSLKSRECSILPVGELAVGRVGVYSKVSMLMVDLCYILFLKNIFFVHRNL